MKLELELKNSKPIPVRRRAMLNILFTASWLDCLLNRHLREYDLTHPQFNILRILNGSPDGLTVLDIKSRMIDRSSNVSRLVEKLRSAGWVARAPHQRDRRMVTVTLSSAGKTLLRKIEQGGLFRAENLPGGKLTDAEMIELADLLDKFRE